MKILFLAPRLPLPADTGGKIRTLNILKQLMKWAEVHLVCFSFEKEDIEWARGLEMMGVNASLVPLKEATLISKVNNILVSLLPHSISKYYSKQMQDVLLPLIHSTRFDAVHIDHLHLAQYQDCLSDLPCVLDEHNVEYKILERCTEVEKSFIKRKIFLNQAKKMKQFEAMKVKEIDQCLAVSAYDKEILNRLVDGQTPIAVIPNGVDTEYFSAPEPQRSSDPEKRNGPLGHWDSGGPHESLVFTGSLDWLPNEDAVLFFCKEILPLIWQKKSDVKFYVVGKGASRAIMNLAAQDPRIVVTGRVDDVRPFISQAKVFVVPIRVGGGTRLKILEAMAMERAIVSTTLGAEGIAYTEGKDILLADQPQDFADKVIALSNDSETTAQMVKSARKLVCALYDWNIIGEKLHKIYEEIIRG